MSRASKGNYGRAVPKASEVLVWINADGSARELREAEKRYVDADFRPADGARPYVKGDYSVRNAWGDLSRYVERTLVPDHVRIDPSPDGPQAP
jgi:hypothetical protein